MYLNSDVVRSLDIRKGEEVTVSVPDRRHIVIERGTGKKFKR
jgi:antitoxin component of MazEF toxin-antitoxin module